MDDKWTITDPSCNQRRRDISDYEFEFIEDRLVNPITKETKSYRSIINLDDYDWFEKIEACSAFGYTATQVDKWLDCGDELPLIAECIFELEEDFDNYET